MRMGRPNKKRRSSKKIKENAVKPKYSSGNLVVGQVSSNVVASFMTPLLNDMASLSLENYADLMLQYDDEVAALRQQKLEDEAASKEKDQEEEVEVNMDGSTTDAVEDQEDDVEEWMPDIDEPKGFLFRSQRLVDEFATDVLSPTARQFSAQTNEWKVHANAAKFERQLDEKYGIFRPFITNHPEVELFLRTTQRKYAMGQFSPLRQGEPPLNRTTAIIMLFMMHRNKVRWEATALAALFFLVGLQPWALVLIVSLGYNRVQARKSLKIGCMEGKIVEPVEPYYKETENEGNMTTEQRKQEFLKTPVGTNLEKGTSLNGSDYDTMVLGSGADALYTAALLSRAGRTVLVLSPDEDASGCQMIQNDDKGFGSVPFDVRDSTVTNVQRQQKLLAPALCTTTDLQGGVRFAQIGTEADGFAFNILSIPGMGTDGSSESIPFVLRAAGGAMGLAEDAATFLGDASPPDDISEGPGNSMTLAYLQACAGMNATASQYYLSKVLPEKYKDMLSTTSYQEATIRRTSQFLDQCLPLNAHIRSLMAAIGNRGENIKPSKMSMGPHVSNLCAATSGEGMHYPIGGPRSLCHALAAVIEQNGGRIVTGVSYKELVFEEKAPKESEKKIDTKKKDDKIEQTETKVETVNMPKCKGVTLKDGTTLILESADSSIEPAVVSTLGFIMTFIHLLPEDIRTNYGVPVGFPALAERRPVLRVLIGLKGTAGELNVTGADYYRLPAAGLARDEVDPVTGQVMLGEIGWTDDNDSLPDDPATEEEGETVGTTGEKRGKRSKQAGIPAPQNKKNPSKRTKYDSGASWMKISFPSAKDPTFAERYGNKTTCIVTIEADDDFVTPFDTKPKLFAPAKADSGRVNRLLERVTKDLIETYPQLEDKIECVEVRGPFGAGLSHTPERYAAKGMRPETPFPGLFVGGSDLTVGDSFSAAMVSGWLATNAVVGYNGLDLMYLSKNITTDLEQFMPEPLMGKEEDLAVPYTPPKSVPLSPAAEENLVTTAEPSKEE
eukprot:scaffold77679_cov48-Attheya_sp.AAC.2